jgi:serine-type D-Ala-D-Ala carboxypeptidase/endopeptidase (penicillin-binding protein 4)
MNKQKYCIRHRIKIYQVLRFLTCCSLINLSLAINISIPNTLKSNLSISIIDADNADVVYNYNESLPRLIASNVKLFTSLFGLTYLGPDFHWHTQLEYTGKIHDHTLYGNLYLKGGGDPTLDSAAVYEIISKLKQSDVFVITGNVILDSSLFNDKPTYSMLQTNQYDADKILPSGLMINENRAKFTIHINSNKVDISHNLYNIKVINQLRLESANDRCNMDDTTNIEFSNNAVTLKGYVNRSCDNISTNFSLLSNFEYNKMALAQVFSDFGIKINGNFENATTPKTARLIYDHSSQSLAHIIYDMNKVSDNLYAETIISSVGAYKTTNQKTFNDGAKIYYNFLQTNGLLNPKFKLENGAGLSRYEYFTASEVTSLLYMINSSTLAAPLEASLPIAMQEGSLHDKFSDFSGRFKAKTGSLNDTRAYSGYFYSKNGQKYIVAFVANNLQNSEQKSLFLSTINQILKQLDNTK